MGSLSRVLQPDRHSKVRSGPAVHRCRSHRYADSIGIGALAKRAGVRIDTVRYYERNGLLVPKARLSSGYRRYGSFEISRLRFIRRAQALGFTLREVRELLALSKRRDIARVKRAAQEMNCNNPAEPHSVLHAQHRRGQRLSDPKGYASFRRR